MMIRKKLYAIPLAAVLMFGAAVTVMAQQVTVQPPVGVTLQATLPVTLPTVSVPTALPTNIVPTNIVPTNVVPTNIATLQPTIQTTLVATTAPTAQSTEAATNATTVAATSQPGTEAASSTAEATMSVIEPSITETPESGDGLVRVGYFAPDGEPVDVYVDNVLYFHNLLFPSISRWVGLQPGNHRITISASGQSTDSGITAPVEVNVSAGTEQTVAIIGTENSLSLSTTIISEDVTALLPGTGGLTFFNALQGSPAVNLVRNKVVYFAQISYPGTNVKNSSASLRGDSGTFEFQVVDASDPSKVLADEPNLKTPENAYTFLALIGTKDSPRLYTLVTDRSEVEIAEGSLQQPGTILDALRANDHLASFANAFENAGLNSLLNGTTQYTIFAPADFVLDNSSTMTADETASALRGYIVEGKYTSRDLIAAGTLTTLSGSELKITTDNNAIYVNGVQIIDVNIAATDGVIHTINGLLK